jgi:hypothetical protein
MSPLEELSDCCGEVFHPRRADPASRAPEWRSLRCPDCREWPPAGRPLDAPPWWARLVARRHVLTARRNRRRWGLRVDGRGATTTADGPHHPGGRRPESPSQFMGMRHN